MTVDSGKDKGIGFRICQLSIRHKSKVKVEKHLCLQLRLKRDGYYMKLKAFSITLIVLLSMSVLTACTPERSVNAMKPNVTMTFDYAEGLRYEPSYAVWIEDESGYHTTVYVTKKAAQSSWGNGERDYVLPIWFGVREKDVDAVAGATSKGSANIQFNIPDEFAGKKITLYMEANASYDYNNYYKENLKESTPGYSDVNGQPSMLWTVEIDPNRQKTGETSMTLAGAGDVLGNNHRVHNDLTNVSTAKKLLTDIKVKYDFVK
jgi:hypothetical protein